MRWRLSALQNADFDSLKRPVLVHSVHVSTYEDGFRQLRDVGLAAAGYVCSRRLQKSPARSTFLAWSCLPGLCCLVWETCPDDLFPSSLLSSFLHHPSSPPTQPFSHIANNSLPGPIPASLVLAVRSFAILEFFLTLLTSILTFFSLCSQALFPVSETWPLSSTHNCDTVHCAGLPWTNPR